MCIIFIYLLNKMSLQKKFSKKVYKKIKVFWLAHGYISISFFYKQTTGGARAPTFSSTAHSVLTMGKSIVRENNYYFAASKSIATSKKKKNNSCGSATVRVKKIMNNKAVVPIRVALRLCLG